MAIKESDFKQELQAVQAQTKSLATKRDGFIRDAGIQQQRSTEALAKLKELGVEGAEKMTVEQLNALRTIKQTELEASVRELQTKANEIDRVVTEYEQATA